MDDTGEILSILIVSYNTRSMTLDCLRSIYSEANTDDFEVIVADNCSCDGTCEAIELEFPQVKLIKSTENLGFARANNVASRTARGRFILLLNPDTLIVDHSVDRLLRFARSHQGAGIWGGRNLSGDGSLDPTSCWRFMSLWSIFCVSTGLARLASQSSLLNREGYGGWARDSVRQVDIVTGCCLLIERRLWDELGGFDCDFFMYGEEADLCYRARKIGARPLITPRRPSSTMVELRSGYSRQK